ncbi:two pore domain potassium channel family protein [Azohydromonas lata]|uniref:Two pore domain potassium channel family protein n=1 Tax=Azohydromonas lata TaxID=45677 RepID=A0ABU5IMZ0_9BURK|nr:two pore domain potassium channel family protein [Azohydromonas lata]MDZ5460250.1 two pore domain potassium channel family protein [Azohydromonas lata]
MAGPGVFLSARHLPGACRPKARENQERGAGLIKRFIVRTRRHPSAILLIVQILGVLLGPFIEEARYSHAVFNIFGIVVLILTTRMVRRTPGLTWVSVTIALPVIVLLVLQVTHDMPFLLPWSSALEAGFYFYAAGSLIAYMMADQRTTVDELFASAATFTLFVWAFTHLFVLVQALQPHAFSADLASVAKTWSELNHLSFALMSSTGMGAVVAVSAHARAIASVEMMTGVMYLATVVARLIGFTIQPKNPR